MIGNSTSHRPTIEPYRLRHDGADHRPRERCIGYGMPYDDGQLLVRCSACKADVGVPCTKRGGGAHKIRGNRAYRLTRDTAFKMFERLENEALRRDPDGPLWSFQGIPHPCAITGPHVLSECPAEGGAA